ncbi:hypothetical protein [Corynebacterium endometrii]|uniref:Uncharacterized protein n=1 Tax=Corynebacterium endometrii TaxID=2488819 RepID=A0A4P7QHF5_9CORY|nr:hypothetical protein [Corynebacterium endometrii]QCB28446.1 hypothetical protein CENDO_05830 [Corynebacterium endometrii]
MTIRSQFQSDIDEFMSDLESFATGSYLKEEEKEFWDEPFDVACLPKLKVLLEGAADGFDGLGNTPTGEALAAHFNSVYANLDAFNSKHADAVIEPEEKQELEDLFRKMAASTGAEEEALAQIPEFE